MKPTTFAPTAMGLGTVVASTNATLPALPVGLVLPQNFPMNLDAQQVSTIQARVDKFDFDNLPAANIAQLGKAPTDNLNRVLDSLLARIDKSEHPQLFKLVDALSDEIAKERIGELAEQMLAARPSLGYRVLGMFSKKKLQEGLDRAYEELGRVAKNKSKTMSDFVTGKEKQLQTEMVKLHEELKNMDLAKTEYRKAFVSVAEEVAFLYSALAKAQAIAPALLAAADKDTMRQQEIQDKLDLLESVAVARDTMMTRLPAEQLVIRQLQNAGVSTLQELSITMGDRFASIRMVLLSIHGANMVRSVQRLNDSGSRLDNQLQAARGKLMATVVTTAANASGNNRLEAANNLRQVVADTQNLQNVVNTARETSREKRAEARNILAEVRQDQLALAQQLNPAASYAA